MSDIPKSLPDSEPTLPPLDGHIIFGNPFQLSGALIEGAEVGATLTIIPEVINTPTGLKIVFNITPPLSVQGSEEKIATISLGSLGQNDPVRMWFAGVWVGKMLSTPGYLEGKLNQARAFYGEEAKIHLPELLYYCFNESFFTKPNGEYLEDNPHGAIQWPSNLPIELLEEIQRRDQPGTTAAVNYQYLDWLISEHVFPELGTDSPIIQGILIRADKERKESLTHQVNIQNGEYATIYLKICDLLLSMGFCVAYEDSDVLDDGIKGVLARVFTLEKLREIFCSKDLLISNKPIINIANLIIDTIIRILEFQSYEEDSPFNNSEFPLVADHVREILITRIYETLVAFQEELGDMGIKDISLGQFATEVYQMGLNNQDPNIRIFLGKQLRPVPEP